MLTPSSLPALAPAGNTPAGRARARLKKAVRQDRSGRLDDAIVHYKAAIEAAEVENDGQTLAEALRLLAITLHRRHDGEQARALCRRSHEEAARAGERLMAAQALNTLAAFDLADGEIDAARAAFHEALRSGGADDTLRGRIEQNLGIIANIQGDLALASAHYGRALEAFRAANDERGCAMAYNSLGIVSADQHRWDDADAYFERSVELTARLGDVHLYGLALLSQIQAHLAHGRYPAAERNAEEALRIFDRLGVARNRSDAHRAMGVVYRVTGRVALAESQLLEAIRLATSVSSVLEEAEAARELARLYRELNRNQDALRLLNSAYGLFNRLDARVDMVDVASRVDELESTFLAVVRDWGQSIESSDSYTHGHCERVATYAIAVARELGLDQHEQTTIRLGAYLHDLGKVRVPPEILNKPGRLTSEEFAVMKQHPVDGIEMLAGVEFPWDIKPMIRWHHEKYDGSGYPDGLRGDEIPLNAQIICIVDVFDALTTTRSYRGAMPWPEALAIIRESRSWWRDDVFAAFMRATEAMTPSDAGAV